MLLKAHVLWIRECVCSPGMSVFLWIVLSDIGRSCGNHELVTAGGSRYVSSALIQSTSVQQKARPGLSLGNICQNYYQRLHYVLQQTGQDGNGERLVHGRP